MNRNSPGPAIPGCTSSGAMTFESLLADPMTRMMMRADRVSEGELVAVLRQARDAVVARRLQSANTGSVIRLASYEPA